MYTLFPIGIMLRLYSRTRIWSLAMLNSNFSWIGPSRKLSYPFKCYFTFDVHLRLPTKVYQYVNTPSLSRVSPIGLIVSEKTTVNVRTVFRVQCSTATFWIQKVLTNLYSRGIRCFYITYIVLYNGLCSEFDGFSFLIKLIKSRRRKYWDQEYLHNHYCE